jgi:hypothetical protein
MLFPNDPLTNLFAYLKFCTLGTFQLLAIPFPVIAVAERGFSVNTALLSKDRMSLDETTIQATRLVKEIIRLHDQPTAVPVTRRMISAVRHAHAKYLIYLEREKQEAAAEAARKKEATQTVENIEIAMKKGRFTNRLHEVEQQERKQLEEQDIAQRLLVKLPVSSRQQSKQVTCRQLKLQKLCWTVEVIS